MTPDRRAALKRRASEACKEMRQFGFDLAKTKEALKSLLKMLDYDWDAIEANHYSLLVDALIASPPPADNSAGEVCFEHAEPLPSTSSRDNVAPVDKKRDAAVLAGEASSSKETGAAVPIPESFEERYWPRADTSSAGPGRKGGVVAPLAGSFCLKKPKPEPDVEDTNTALIPAYEHEEGQMNPARKAFQENNNTETSHALNNDRTQCTLPIDNIHVVESDSVDNHEEPGTGPNTFEMNGKCCDNRKKDKPVCFVTTFELAASSNNKVKMCLSINHECTNFQLPHIDSVLEAIESKCSEVFNINQPEFSVMDLMKEVCETFAELDKSGI